MKMNTFYLEILSPERTFYAGECLSLTVPVSDGILGIMAHHTPLSAAIEDGEITFTKPDGEKVRCAAMLGMVDVADNKVQVLCESVLLPEEIDEEAERRAAAEAAHALKNQQSQKEYILWQLSFNKALNRLKIKNKDSKINL